MKISTQALASLLARLESNPGLRQQLISTSVATEEVEQEAAVLFKNLEDSLSSQACPASKVLVNLSLSVAHPGHFSMLKYAKSLGSHVILGLISHDEMALHKCPLINSLEERKLIAESCRFVDEVLLDTPFNVSAEFLDSISADIAVVKTAPKGDPRVKSFSTSYSTSSIVGKAILRSKVPSDNIEPGLASQSSGELKAFYTGKESSGRVVYTDGVFDLLSTPQISLLQEAKALGDYLIVGLHNAPTLQAMNERAINLLSLKYVDDVYIDAPSGLSSEFLSSLNISIVASATVREVVPPATFHKLTHKDSSSDLEERVLSLNSSQKKYVGAIDQGTGSTRFILFDMLGNQVASHQIDISQSFPGPQMHEQEATEYVDSTLMCIEKAMQKSGISPSSVICIGITNQRETVIAWDKDSGKPLHSAIVWDDFRTADICKEFTDPLITEKTGLPVSPYFSATKMIWLIRNVPSVQEAINKGTCRFGTVESWLIHNLTEERCYVTDISNASRTLLMNLDGYWDPFLLQTFGVPENSLPVIRSSAEVYGFMKSGCLKGIPISGTLGDQQAALLGHKCLEKGAVKNTYGTGAFLMMNTGTEKFYSKNGLLGTVFGQFGPSKPIHYALEGAIEGAGSCIKWAINQIGLVNSLDEVETVGRSVENTGGVVFVSALSGLFAPHWRPDAKGLFIGLTQYTTKAHLVRAVLEGVAYRTAEALEALAKDANLEIERLSVDGGMARNLLFLEIQAEVIGKEVEVPLEKDLTALGAALTASIGIGWYQDIEDIKELKKTIQNRINPRTEGQETTVGWGEWKKALSKSFD